MRLSPLPEHFVSTKDSLHQVAFFAVSPARYKSVGRMGLTATPGGFGTPPFDDSVARVEGDMLVFEKDGNVASRTITTIREAARFFGLEYEASWFADFHDPLDPADPDEIVAVEDGAARALGQWFNFAFEVLRKLGAQGTEEDDVSQVQLWPEHFDPATELGDQERGRRASFGASPGDSGHDEPYFYVAPWGDIDTSNSYWNDRSFRGSSLGYARLVGSDDPVQTALDFLLEGYGILHTD